RIRSPTWTRAPPPIPRPTRHAGTIQYSALVRTVRSLMRRIHQTPQLHPTLRSPSATISDQLVYSSLSWSISAVRPTTGSSMTYRGYLGVPFSSYHFDLVAPPSPSAPAPPSPRPSSARAMHEARRGEARAR